MREGLGVGVGHDLGRVGRRRARARELDLLCPLRALEVEGHPARVGLEGEAEAPRVLKALLALPRHGLVDDALEPLAHVGADLPEVRRRAGRDLENQSGIVLGDEWRASRDHLVEDHAGRVHVDAMVDVVSAADLLG